MPLTAANVMAGNARVALSFSWIFAEATQVERYDDSALFNGHRCSVLLRNSSPESPRFPALAAGVPHYDRSDPSTFPPPPGTARVKVLLMAWWPGTALEMLSGLVTAQRAAITVYHLERNAPWPP
ncbi:hypothetical protein SKAU_G00033220 [Synaphobranchus kaupii]|uniref:Uncharacterized protein n=1 Tax=Synaphobranchus kaupii TaxID=118154 RepID=A0A9Q1JGF8_SYNKA|nr:hypothetical protein SKAU_G00033220 [Synaphobranchus kaupii]